MKKPKLVEEHEAAGKRIVVDGHHIFVREEGEGEPVLLLHGVPSSSFLYRKMLPELAAKGLRAVSFDFPGMGLSDKPKDTEYDWHALAKWVGRVVDALELPPVHLFLHDIAGPIGCEWAIQNPVKVRSITLANTPMDVAHYQPAFPMWSFRIPILKHVVFSTLNVPTALKLFRYSGVRNPDVMDEDIVESYLHLVRMNGGHRSFLRIMDGLVCTEEHRDYLRDGLLAIEKPTQLVWGEEEIAIPKAQMHFIKQVFPLRAVHMVDARHFLQEEHPAVIASHIATFAADIAQSPKRATPAAD